MSTPPPERIAVIAGIGEITDRVAPGQIGMEPLQLLIESARLADKDSNGLLRDVESVELVAQWNWRYKNLAGILAEKLELSGAKALETPPGGNMSTKLLADMAMRISRGELTTALLCGAESTYSIAQAAKTKTTPPWTPQDDSVKRMGGDFLDKEAIRYGLRMPVDVYAIYENACRAAWKQTLKESQHESGVIGAKMSEVAATDPFAWSPNPTSAEAIASPSLDNRMVIFPYTKLMIANPMVNQGAAVIVTTLARARAAGIADDKLVYIGSGAGGSEPRDFMQRSNYHSAPAMDAVLKRTLALNNLQADKLDLLELYSCFPCVPKLARRSLGIGLDRPLTVAGGLVFFGAPTNTYMTNAICAMTRALRSGRGENGLLYGNGEFVTKHHATVLFKNAPTRTPENLDLQNELDAAYGPVPPMVRDYVGPSTLETYTVMYTRDGAPEFANLIARTPDGGRHLAKVGSDNPAVLDWLVSGASEPIGTAGIAARGSDDFIHWQPQLGDKSA